MLIVFVIPDTTIVTEINKAFKELKYLNNFLHILMYVKKYSSEYPDCGRYICKPFEKLLSDVSYFKNQKNPVIVINTDCTFQLNISKNNMHNLIKENNNNVVIINYCFYETLCQTNMYTIPPYIVIIRAIIDRVNVIFSNIDEIKISASISDESLKFLSILHNTDTLELLSILRKILEQELMSKRINCVINAAKGDEFSKFSISVKGILRSYNEKKIVVHEISFPRWYGAEEYLKQLLALLRLIIDIDKSKVNFCSLGTDEGVYTFFISKLVEHGVQLFIDIVN